MRRAALVAFTLLSLSRAAGAHVPVLRGHLVELTQSAGRIVIARVESASRRPGGDSRLALQVVATLRGPRAPRTFEILSANYLAPGQRYVFFLRSRDTVIESLAPPGVVFAAQPADDQGYRRVVAQLSAALSQPEPGRTDTVRAALVEALTTSAEALRYQAAVDLAALAAGGHGPTAHERQRLERIGAATSDPALKRLITTLLASDDTPGPKQ